MKDTFKSRQRTIQLVFLIGAILLLFKAMQLQLFDTSYQAKANATAIDKIVLYPSRGLIYDRNMKLLINNNAMYDLKVTYNRIDPDMDTLKFCNLLGIDRETFEKNLDKDFKSARYKKYAPFIFLKKISAEQYARFQEHLYEFPGFYVQIRNVRGYPHSHGAHVLGYINEVNQTQIDASEGKYARGDYIGASGLELAYEDYLRGSKGVQYVLKDNLGREVGPYKEGALDSSAVSGHDLITSIDLGLQEYGEYLMQGKTGSIVAIEPQTGEILSMISTPTYDPNLLTINRDRGHAYVRLLQDTLKPFFDRTVMAKYPPGSIFKTVMSLAAMQEGVTHPDRYISCSGAYYYRDDVWKCHGHPAPFNLPIALQHSCNTYFFQMLRDVVDKNGFYNPHEGLDTLVQYLHDFGLGNTLGIDIPNESSGNIPTSEYYDYLYPKKKGGWKSPTIISIGIGQGEVQLTTLQIANLAAIIANKGKYYIPHLAKGFKNQTTIIPEKYRTLKQVRVDEQFFEPVIEGMRRVVDSGTGNAARVRGIPVCGKTGTSQNPHGKDHSVFFAFAPQDDPKIAIAVYVENGGFGSTFAAPITGLMIEKYLKGEISPEKVAIEERMNKTILNGRP